MHKRHRLGQSRQFQRVRREGQSWAHPLLVLITLRNELPYSRFGFLVSKRIGRAVARNRVKRLMREAARARLSDIPPGWDIILIARAAIAEADLERIKLALDSLLQRAGLLTKPPEMPDVDK
jgi:ribonuclease P protein component